MTFSQAGSVVLLLAGLVYWWWLHRKPATFRAQTLPARRPQTASAV